MSGVSRDDLIQVLVNFDEVVRLVGLKKLEDLGALKSVNKIYHILNLVAEVGKVLTYELVEKDGEPGIKCLKCQMVSFHPEDIKQKYCGNCHAFHER